MNQKYFPAIVTQNISGGVEAVLGLEVKSLLKGDLYAESKSSQIGGEKSAADVDEHLLITYRESLIRAISAWSKSITLELIITSLPNLRFNARGRVLITMFLRSKAKSKIKACEQVITKYLTLCSLLLSHFTEAEFVPITSRDELLFHSKPFLPAYARSVCRRTENIQVSEPFKKNKVVGLSIDNPEKHATIAHGHSIKYIYPWIPSFDDWSRIISVLMHQLDPMQLVVRLRPAKFSSTEQKIISNNIRLCELHLRAGEPFQLGLIHQTTLLRNALVNQLNALSDCAFNVAVFLLAEHPIDAALGHILGQSISGKAGTTENNLLCGGFSVVTEETKTAIDSGYFPEENSFTVSEAACAFRLPSPPMQEIPGLPLRRSRTSLALLPEVDSGEEESIDVCRNIHNGLTQSVRLPADDRMRHMFIIGQTGTGKSTLMESMVLQDIRAGHGLAVIDPHGEMVDSILGKIPWERREDVILFDFLDRERPLGFNLIEWRTIEERDFIIDEMYDSLAKIYDMKQAGGPIYETNLRGMLRLLMGDKPADDFKPTLLEFRNCYLYRKFRDWLLERNDDQITYDFIRELEKSGGEAHIDNISQYITSKFGRFVHDTTLMNIIGQEKNAFDFEEVMTREKILLVKLGKGRFGSSVSALLANQLVSRFKQAAMKRGEMRPEERKDFYLYVDECHNLPASNFTELLSEARKYRMGLVLATQYAAQLKDEDNKENLLSAILGNVGCLAIFRLGPEDAQLFTSSLYPYFKAMDIMGLPNWQGYCRLQIRNNAVVPFSFESLWNETPYDQRVANAVREYSRETYGCNVEIIRKQITRRQNIWKA
jgi:hypothetical protein